MKNGEKFKTAEERVMAFNEYCDKNSCQKCFDDGHIYSVPCLLKWLDFEAEKEKPLPCPFCGGEIYLAHDSYGQAYVGCKNCRYTYSNDGKSDDEIIADHNRVAKDGSGEGRS